MMSEEFLSVKQTMDIDIFILKTLKELLLHRNFWYVDIRDFITDDILSEISCIRQDIEERIMYNYWMGFLEMDEINEVDIEKIKEKSLKKNIDFNIFFKIDDDKKVFDKELFYNHFLCIKITSTWLKQIEELDIQIKEMRWLNGVFNKLKSILEALWKIKFITGVLFTIVFIGLIFIFDIKISWIIKNIPILNSIINTDILEAFEEVNKNDEFYKNLSSELYNKDKLLPNMIKNIRVRAIDNNEKIFKLRFNSGEEMLISVVKDANWKFRIILPEKLLNFKNKNMDINLSAKK